MFEDESLLELQKKGIFKNNEFERLFEQDRVWNIIKDTHLFKRK